MISYIKGTIVDMEADQIILECQDIGYRIFVPASFFSEYQKTGSKVKVFTFLNVKEDSVTLFGFSSKDELKLFKKMITVSGIGPKGALAILSAMTVEQLKLAILSEDAKAIAKAPGIGAKTASKLILELKDKVSFDDIFSPVETAKMASSADPVSAAVKRDAVEGLTALGYSPSEALNAVERAATEDINDAGELIKLALRSIK